MREFTLDLQPGFAEAVHLAIKRSGLTYRQAAMKLKPHLPQGVLISDVSLWSYAKGRARPRRIDVVKAISCAFDISLEELIVMNKRRREESQEISIRDLNNGKAFISVKLTLPMSIAEKVHSVLADLEQAEASASSLDEAAGFPEKDSNSNEPS